MTGFLKLFHEKGIFQADNFRGNHVVSYGRMSYYQLRSLPDRLLAFVDALKPDGVRWVEAAAGETVRPHKDHGITVGLNYYVQTTGSITSFWDVVGDAKPFCLPGQAKAHMYNWEDLKKVGEFVAVDGDAYLLNVAALHSVDSTYHLPRIFFQLHWKTTSFEDVAERIKEKGL